MASLLTTLVLCVAMTMCMAASRHRRQAGQPVVSANVRCPGERGTFPIDGQCEYFMDCWDNVPYIKNCIDGLVFNPQSSQCDYPGNVPSCSTLANPASAQYCSRDSVIPGQAYKVAHPDWCNAFFTCQKGHVHQKCEFCPQGTYFNGNVGLCLNFNAQQQQTLCGGKTIVAFELQTLERLSNQCSTALVNPDEPLYNSLKNKGPIYPAKPNPNPFGK